MLSLIFITKYWYLKSSCKGPLFLARGDWIYHASGTLCHFLVGSLVFPAFPLLVPLDRPALVAAVFATQFALLSIFESFAASVASGKEVGFVVKLTLKSNFVGYAASYVIFYLTIWGMASYIARTWQESI